jgi:hypothetical protein
MEQKSQRRPRSFVYIVIASPPLPTAKAMTSAIYLLPAFLVALYLLSSSLGLSFLSTAAGKGFAKITKKATLFCLHCYLPTHPSHPPLISFCFPALCAFELACVFNKLGNNRT